MSTLNLIGAADMMKVHPKTVEIMIHDGRLPAARIGRAYVLLEKDVLAYIEAAIVEQTAQRLGIPTKATRRGRRRANLNIA